MIRDDILVTFFNDAAAKRWTTERMSLIELRERILRTSAATKLQLPWLKLAKFGTLRSVKGSLRHNANVLEISGAEADYDGERIAFDAAVAALAKAHIGALVYTSPSHSQTKPRWRILAPTSKTLPPHSRAQLVARLNGLFAGVLSQESFTLSQSYYFGRISNNPAHRVSIIAGDYIDQRYDLDHDAIGKRQKPAEAISERAIQQRKRRDPIDADLIVAALEVIPSDAYWPWLEIGAALYHEFGGGGFPLFDWWSAGSSKYNINQCAMKWRECRKFTKYSGRTILFYADKAAPGWRKSYEIAQWQQFLKIYTKR